MPALIDPASMTLADFLRAHEFRQASIQRDYQWTPSEVRKLVDDLWGHLERKEADGAPEGYFIGSFVGSRDEGRIALYDGLQRTTTLTLLCAMVRDLLAGSESADRLHDCIATASRFRLQLEGQDPTLHEKVQPRGATLEWEGGGRRYGREQHLREARQTIRQRLAAVGVLSGRGKVKRGQRARLDAFATVLLEDVHLVYLDAPSVRLAERMFQTLNMRGLPVQDVDLVKSQLPALAKREADATRLVAAWDEMRNRVHARFRDFMLAVNVVERGAFAEQPFGTLVDWLEENVRSNPRFVADWIQRLTVLAPAWNDLCAIWTLGTSRNDNFVSALPLWALDWDEWVPYALLVIGEWHARTTPRWRITKRQRQAAGRLALDRLAALTSLCTGLEIGNFHRRYRQDVMVAVCRSFRADPDGHELHPLQPGKRRQVAERLVRGWPDPTRRQRLLFLYEALLAENLKRLKVAPRDGGPSVEHVLPQHPAEGSPWLLAFPDDQVRARCENLLGNLALVPSRINDAMGNGSFEAKRALLEAHADELAGLHLVQSVLAEEAWTPEVVHRRTQQMVRELWARCGLPDEDVPVVAIALPSQPSQDRDAP